MGWMINSTICGVEVETKKKKKKKTLPLCFYTLSTISSKKMNKLKLRKNSGGGKSKYVSITGSEDGNDFGGLFKTIKLSKPNKPKTKKD